MSQTIAVIIGFVVAVVLFLITGKFRIRNKLIQTFYKWFKNKPPMVCHILAFVINFAIILGVGIINSLLMQNWFTMTVFPIAIVIVLNVSTALIAVGKTIAYERTQVKITPKKKINRNKNKSA